MRPTALMISLTLIVPVSLRSQPSSDLRISWPTPTVLEIDYEPTIWTHALGSGGVNYVRIDFPGARTDPSKPGDLIIPYRPVSLLTPSRTFSVTIVDTEYAFLETVPLAGYPGSEPDELFGASLVFNRASLSTYHALFPGTLSDIVDIAQSEAGFGGTLKLFPVHYDPARQAMRIYRRIRLRFTFTGKDPTQAVRSQRAGTFGGSPLEQGEWYKMDVGENGIYKLDQSFFAAAGIPNASIASIQSLRIYGNGGEEVPENLLLPRPNGLQEIPRLVVDKDGDGNFDSEDFVLFYGRSPRGWKYNPSTRTFSHYLNHYTETNHYFISFGVSPGRGMDSVASLSQPGVPIPATFQGKVFFEEERNNLINSGREWVGQFFSVENKVFISNTLLPGYDPQPPVIYRFVVLGRSTTNQSFRIDENGDFLGRITTTGFNTASIENNYAYRSPVTSFSRFSPLPGGRSVLRFEFEATTSGPEGWLDWIEIFYRQAFNAVDDRLLFTSHDTTGVVQYDLGNFSSRDVFAFDVTDHANVKRITNLVTYTADPSRFSFQLSELTGNVRELYAVGPGGFRLPTNVRRVDQTNLTGITSGADFVIVAPKDFAPEAERLKAYRE